MKRFILIILILIVIGAVGFAGYYAFYSSSADQTAGNTEESSAKSENDNKSTADTDGAGLTTTKLSGMYKQAYEGDATLVCDAQSSGTITKFVKNGRILSKGVPPERIDRDLTTYTLRIAHKDKADDIYTWQTGSDADDTGQHYTSNTETENVPDTETVPSVEETLAKWNESDSVTCRKESIPSEVSFTKPDNITFESR